MQDMQRSTTIRQSETTTMVHVWPCATNARDHTCSQLHYWDPTSTDPGQADTAQIF